MYAAGFAPASEALFETRARIMWGWVNHVPVLGHIKAGVHRVLFYGRLVYGGLIKPIWVMFNSIWAQ